MTRYSGIIAPAAAAVVIAAGLGATLSSPAGASAHGGHVSSHHQAKHHRHGALPGGYKHLVVIYQENHSFDNLYGSWGSVNGQQVDGLRTPQPAQHDPGRPGRRRRTAACCRTTSTSPRPPLPDTCTDAAHGVPRSHFTNAPFTIDNYIAPDRHDLPGAGRLRPERRAQGQPALPGGCTRDLVHRFYQEQYQINGGRQNRYVTGSRCRRADHGHYDTKSCRSTSTCTARARPNYVIADHFFQAAFGGSFLNHQCLIAARSPLDTSRRAPAGAQELRAGQQRFAEHLPALHSRPPSVTTAS